MKILVTMLAIGMSLVCVTSIVHIFGIAPEHVIKGGMVGPYVLGAIMSLVGGIGFACLWSEERERIHKLEMAQLELLKKDD